MTAYPDTQIAFVFTVQIEDKKVVSKRFHSQFLKFEHEIKMGRHLWITWLSWDMFQVFKSEIFSLSWTTLVSMLFTRSAGCFSLTAFEDFLPWKLIQFKLSYVLERMRYKVRVRKRDTKKETEKEIETEIE